MKISKVVSENITRGFGRALLKTKFNSPHIFFAGGIIGVIGSTVLACRATLKLEEVLDEVNTDVDKLKSAYLGKPEGNSYLEKEYRKELIVVCAKGGAKIAKLYAPSAALGVASIGLLTGSHIQMTRRNSALSATLALTSKAFDDYRSRVREVIGEDRELDVYRATKNTEVEIDGKKKIMKLTDPSKISPYSRFFDEFSTCWQKDPELNKIFLTCQQNYANHLLRARGHVFLNEVYDALGMERSQAGQVVGWVLNGEGDNYIDFGIYETTNSRFVNNTERSILLDFNVDGVVYDKI